jgi:hypothetical protein
MASAGALDHLYTMKFQKIKEQKALSDRMHDMLSKSGGLNESSKMALKNLQAAITVSKRPGYFDYYGEFYLVHQKFPFDKIFFNFSSA